MLDAEKLAEKMANAAFYSKGSADALHGIEFYLKSTCGTGLLV